MVEFQRIESPQDPFLDSYYNLYETAFPPEERRGRKEFEQLLGKEARFFSNILLVEGVFIGFFNYWMLTDFCFVEHFAISPDFRNKKYGTKVFELLLEWEKEYPVILEVEPPTTEDATRRIEFYKRLGFYLLEQEYAQPLYDDRTKFITLLLMSQNPDFINNNFDRIKTSIYSAVYSI